MSQSKFGSTHAWVVLLCGASVIYVQGVHPNRLSAWKLFVSLVVSWTDTTGVGATQVPFLNSLAPGEFQENFRYVIFKRILVIDGWGISCEIALIWMSLDLNYEKSTLVQVMAWCCQATSHYLSHCWPRSLSPYGVSRPLWVDFFIRDIFYFADTFVVVQIWQISLQLGCGDTCKIWTWYIQLSAVITWSSIVRYYMNNYKNWSRISIRC